METTTAEPEVTLDQQDEKFLEAAAKADRGEDIPADLIGADKPEERAPGTEEKAVETTDGKLIPDNSETSTETAEQKAERERDEKGRFKAKEPEGVKKPDEPKAEPGTSEYEAKKAEKAAKEKERQDRSWDALNREKEEARTRIQAEEQRLAQERSQCI